MYSAHCTSCQKTLHNLRHVNWETYSSSSLNNVDWIYVLDCTNSNQAWIKFKDIVHHFLNIYSRNKYYIPEINTRLDYQPPCSDTECHQNCKDY